MHTRRRVHCSGMQVPVGIARDEHTSLCRFDDGVQVCQVVSVGDPVFHETENVPVIFSRRVRFVFSAALV